MRSGPDLLDHYSNCNRGNVKENVLGRATEIGKLTAASRRFAAIHPMATNALVTTVHAQNLAIVDNKTIAHLVSCLQKIYHFLSIDSYCFTSFRCCHIGVADLCFQ
jgi:hypothetical protein